MDRLRPRERQVVSGFTKPEIDKMEKMLKDSVERLFDPENCRRITKSFNRSSGRAGKAVLKWTEVQNWFQLRLQECPSTSMNMSENGSFLPESSPSEKAHTDSQMPKGENIPALSDLEFEAKSSKDGAWYDIEMFLTHRAIDPDETEVCVRYVGFGAEEDEWVNVRNAVRLRSIPIEHSECPKVKVGETVLCLQERRDQSLYYDAQVVDIQRKMHDVRGCRCIFIVRYNHDGTQEKVRLRRLCFLANP